MVNNFDLLGFILNNIHSCIDYMKNIYPFSNYGNLFFSQMSFFDLFIGLSVGSVLLTIFLNFFGEDAQTYSSPDPDEQDDSPYLDEDDY